MPRIMSDRGGDFFTIGHSNRELDEFLEMITEHSIETVVDVRKLAGSRRYPQFNADTLADALAAVGIELTRFEGLTGRRPASKTVPFETNAWWQNRSFHNYADHALSAEFGEALRALRELGHEKRAAVMCAEAVWWRCHRRIIADYLLAADEQVIHVLGPGSETPGSLSEGAVPENGLLTYPEPLSPAPEAESHRSSRAAFSRT